MKSYMFDLGDSADGAIGMVVRVTAADKSEAVRLAQQALGLVVGDCGEVSLPVPDEVRHAVEYINIYINPANLTEADIFDGETEDEPA